MRKLNQNNFEELDLGEDEAVEDTRTMKEVMRDKRLKQDQEIEEAKSKQENYQETVEERKARLAAQRDLLRKIKDDKRQQELDEFNQRLTSQPGEDGLYNQFKKMDENKKMSNAELELEKRRQIFKNVRKEIDRDEKA